MVLPSEQSLTSSSTPAVQTSPASRETGFLLSAANVFAAAARLALVGTIILAPFRFRTVLLMQSITSVWGDYTNLIIYASDILMIATLVFWLLSLAFHPRPVSFRPYGLSIALA